MSVHRMLSDPIPKTLITVVPELDEAAGEEWEWAAVREQAEVVAAAGEAWATDRDDLEVTARSSARQQNILES